jgi:tRNA(Ile)-lysidine synthase
LVSTAVHPSVESSIEGPAGRRPPGDPARLEAPRGSLAQAIGVLPRDARVVAAVSGGPDSTALLIGLVENQRDVIAAHYDHALRPDSDRDAAHVAELCHRLGVGLVTERRSAPMPRGSLQAGARALRYEFLERALRTSGRDLVALGHTADDVVEGAVMHLLRGSGLAGLRGMPARRGPFVRPMLGVWRWELAAFLEDRGVRSLEDPANRDTARFARARVRHELLPRLERDSPGLKRRLWGAAAAAAGLQERLEREAAALGRDRESFRAASRVVRLEAYRQLYGRQPALSRRHLEAMDALTLRGRTGAGLDLPGGLRFRLGQEQVEVGPAEPGDLRWLELRSRPCPGCDEAGVVHLRAGLRLELRPRIPGLRMRPLGGPGTRKLQDILTDARVPRHVRDRLPLVFAEGRLAWVPGIAVDTDAVALGGEPAQHVWLEGADVTEGGWRAYHLS